MSDFKIIPIDKKTWQIDEGMVRFFLLEGNERALLIDSGMTVKDVKSIAERLTDLPVELINTHADGDHIGGNDEFGVFYMSPYEASNYYHPVMGGENTGRIKPVWDGDIIDLGDRRLKIINIPGHTPGSIGILDIDRRILFSGDPVQTGEIFMFGIQREIHAYVMGLRRLYEMRDEFDLLYPSHEDCPVKPELIRILADAAEEILRGEREWTSENIFDTPLRRYDVGYAVFLCDEPDSQGK